MNTLIVEDKEYVRKGLLKLLKLIKAKIDVIGECESVEEAVIVSNVCKPELVFLDINLTDGTAFDFLEKTNHLNFKVIFITAHKEYALKALKSGAVDYLLKPVDIEDLRIALQKINKVSFTEQRQKINTVRHALNNSNSQLILSLQDSYQVINLDELLFCKSDKGYTTFYCNDNKKYVVSKTLKEFEEPLIEANFIRTHRSFMVNLNFISKYDKSGEIYLINGEKIPVSFRKKESFLKAFLKR